MSGHGKYDMYCGSTPGSEKKIFPSECPDGFWRPPSHSSLSEVQQQGNEPSLQWWGPGAAETLVPLRLHGVVLN
jgi:hypothetical protein